MVDNDFAGKLIKGRIAETVFELMFREGTDFDIYPLGYEHTIPILPQLRDEYKDKKGHIINQVIDNLSTSPDFLLIKPDKSEAFFVEVKYISKLEDYKPEKIKEIAEKVQKRWDPVWLFLATPNGFYFDSCNDILNHNGSTKPLDWVGLEFQDKYLNLIQEFEK